MMIIKYFKKGRKLYSYNESKIITYAHIRAYVNDDLDIKVIVHPGGEDITAKTLIKALVDIGTELSVDGLKELIKLAPLEGGRKKANNMMMSARMTESEERECVYYKESRLSRDSYGERG